MRMRAAHGHVCWPEEGGVGKLDGEKVVGEKGLLGGAMRVERAYRELLGVCVQDFDETFDVLTVVCRCTPDRPTHLLLYCCCCCC